MNYWQTINNNCAMISGNRVVAVACGVTIGVIKFFFLHVLIDSKSHIVV